METVTMRLRVVYILYDFSPLEKNKNNKKLLEIESSRGRNKNENNEKMKIEETIQQRLWR